MVLVDVFTDMTIPTLQTTAVVNMPIKKPGRKADGGSGVNYLHTDTSHHSCPPLENENESDKERYFLSMVEESHPPLHKGPRESLLSCQGTCLCCACSPS